MTERAAEARSSRGWQTMERRRVSLHEQHKALKGFTQGAASFKSSFWQVCGVRREAPGAGQGGAGRLPLGWEGRQ